MIQPKSSTLLEGLQMASGAVGGLVGSWVAMSREWSLGVAVDLGGSRVTLTTSQIFTKAPNFRIEKATESSRVAFFI
jgi:hypothetical protein